MKPIEILLPHLDHLVDISSVQSTIVVRIGYLHDGFDVLVINFIPLAIEDSLQVSFVYVTLSFNVPTFEQLNRPRFLIKLRVETLEHSLSFLQLLEDRDGGFRLTSALTIVLHGPQRSKLRNFASIFVPHSI